MGKKKRVKGRKRECGGGKESVEEGMRVWGGNECGGERVSGREGECWGRGENVGEGEKVWGGRESFGEGERVGGDS